MSLAMNTNNKKINPRIIIVSIQKCSSGGAHGKLVSREFTTFPYGSRIPIQLDFKFYPSVPCRVKIIYSSIFYQKKKKRRNCLVYLPVVA